MSSHGALHDKALVGTFNQEKALIVILTSRMFVSSSGVNHPDTGTLDCCHTLADGCKLSPCPRQLWWCGNPELFTFLPAQVPGPTLETVSVWHSDQHSANYCPGSSSLLSVYMITLNTTINILSREN